MADTKSAKSKRRIRESTETMRERGVRADEASAKVPSRSLLRRALSSLAGLAIWKPFKVAGRIVAKYTVPPYFKNSWRELKLVTWPDAKKSRQLTLAVMIFAIIFGVIVATVDYGLDKLFKKVILGQ